MAAPPNQPEIPVQPTGEGPPAAETPGRFGLKRVLAVVHGPNHKWWAMSAVMTGVFMSTLDAGTVAVSLPTIMARFNAPLTMVQWIVLAYLIVITVTLLAFGRLSDMYGRKQVYTLGFMGFTLGAALCSMAGSAEQLVLFRAFQAVGASMLMANGMAITSSVFPAHERGKGLGIQVTVVAIGTTLGPTVGGLLTQNFGWRSIFYVVIPVGIFGVAAASLVLRNSVITPSLYAGRRASFDFLGALLAGCTLLTFLLGLTGLGQIGLPEAVVRALFAAAALFFVAFLLVERRVREPMIDLGLFRQKLFGLGAAAALLSFLAISSNMFLLPFYLQLILHYPPAQAGLLMAPTSLAILVVAPVAGWLSDRTGARLLSSVGLSLACLALFSLSRLDTTSGYGDVVLRLVLLGIGQGMFHSPNNSSVIGSVPRERYGVAGGFLSMMRNLGTVMGTALASGLLVGGLIASAGHVNLAALGGAGAGDDPALIAGFMAGMERAYLVAAALAALGVLASLSRGGSFSRGGAAVPSEQPRSSTPRG